MTKKPKSSDLKMVVSPNVEIRGPVRFTAEQIKEFGIEFVADKTLAKEEAAKAGIEYLGGNSGVLIKNPKAFIAFAEENLFPVETIRRLREELQESKHIMNIAGAMLTQGNTVPTSETSKQKQKSPKPQSQTLGAIQRLQEIRLDAIRDGREIPTRAAAMHMAGITDKTWKKYDLELWARWDDKNYHQEKQE